MMTKAPAQGQGDGGESEIQRGFQIAPVPLNLAGKNRSLVGLGSYLFKTVLRTGTDFKAIPPHIPSNPGLLQVMPWPAYRYSTDRFIETIYEYLSAIPCRPGGPAPGSATRCGP